ncbi:LOW QUALITY PROTEIN: putative N(4)-(beta-N-acetylglucosaminyl)-L-asparaginase GA14866 [Morus bassanus]
MNSGLLTIRHTRNDTSTRGYANKHGLIQRHAAIMEGHPGHSGAVAALPGVKANVFSVPVHPSVCQRRRRTVVRMSSIGELCDTLEILRSCPLATARKAMERTTHSLLVGDGLIALDVQGNITVCVSNSGAPFKYPGRLGDHSSPGCGLQGGHKHKAAALALQVIQRFAVPESWVTGDGDRIMWFCLCFHVALLMKQGLSSLDACQTVLQDI